MAAYMVTQDDSIRNNARTKEDKICRATTTCLQTPYTFAFRRGVETRPTTLEVVTISRDARGGKLNSRYRSTSSTTLAKLPRGCVATERMRNQVVSTTIYRTEIHIFIHEIYFTYLHFTIICLKTEHDKKSFFFLSIAYVACSRNEKILM